MRQIVSGGQTGVDRAALDVAIVRGLPHGGWCPRGRLAEDGPIPLHYQLRETPTGDYAVRTEWNVRDSDGTLIVTRGQPTSGTALTHRLARQHGRPCLVIDVSTPVDVNHFTDWITRQAIEVLNIAGPRRSQWPRGYRTTLAVLNELIERVTTRSTSDVTS